MNIPVSALPSVGCGPYAPVVSSVGKNLKEVREERGLTQDQIAKQCGVPQNQWSKWESGKSEPKIKSLLRVAVALDLPLNRFVIGVNREFDLARHGGDRQSGLSPVEGADANVPAAARLELQRLRDLVARYEKEAREVRTVFDALGQVALNLEEVRKTSAGTPARRGRDRKAG